jgi:hypothetical protein
MKFHLLKTISVLCLSLPAALASHDASSFGAQKVGLRGLDLQKIGQQLMQGNSTVLAAAATAAGASLIKKAWSGLDLRCAAL